MFHRRSSANEIDHSVDNYSMSLVKAMIVQDQNWCKEDARRRGKNQSLLKFVRKIGGDNDGDNGLKYKN